MLRRAKVALSFVMLAFMLMVEGTTRCKRTVQTTRSHQCRCRRKAL